MIDDLHLWGSRVSQSVSAIVWRSMMASCSASVMPRPRQDVSTRAAWSSVCFSQATATTSTFRPDRRSFSPRRRRAAPQECSSVWVLMPGSMQVEVARPGSTAMGILM